MVEHPHGELPLVQARYFNSWGQQALQQQATTSTMSDGTGVNWVFHPDPELWPMLDEYFSSLAQLLFVKYDVVIYTLFLLRIHTIHVAIPYFVLLRLTRYRILPATF